MERAVIYLKDKVKRHDYHYAATFLCPNVRALKNFTEEERTRAHGAVKRVYGEVTGMAQQQVLYF